MSQIVAVLEFYGAPLVPRSSSWRKMRCPFHDDKHPSASVGGEANRFVCFTCGINENAPGLIMLREGGTYANAVKRANEIAGESGHEVQSESFNSEWVPSRPRLVGSKRGGALASWGC